MNIAFVNTEETLVGFFPGSGIKPLVMTRAEFEGWYDGVKVPDDGGEKVNISEGDKWKFVLCGRQHFYRSLRKTEGRRFKKWVSEMTLDIMDIRRACRINKDTRTAASKRVCFDKTLQVSVPAGSVAMLIDLPYKTKVTFLDKKAKVIAHYTPSRGGMWSKSYAVREDGHTLEKLLRRQQPYYELVVL